jgi:hypothetical protein
VAAQAANALGTYGSAAAQAPLWARLESFHETWKNRADELSNHPIVHNPHWDQVPLETGLWRALGSARGWVLDEEGADRLVSLVVSEHGVDQVRFVRVNYDHLEIYVSVSEGADIAARIASYDVVSVDNLLHKLGQFPAGSAFHWSSWTDGDGSKLLEARGRVQAACERYGHTLID